MEAELEEYGDRKIISLAELERIVKEGNVVESFRKLKNVPDQLDIMYGDRCPWCDHLLMLCDDDHIAECENNPDNKRCDSCKYWKRNNSHGAVSPYCCGAPRKLNPYGREGHYGNCPAWEISGKVKRIKKKEDKKGGE